MLVNVFERIRITSTPSVGLGQTSEAWEIRYRALDCISGHQEIES